MSDVFISHSSKDAEIANNVCKFLEDKGLSCWIAPRNIVPGADWAASINTAITASKVFLVIFSKNCASSTQVPHEIGLAESRSNVYTIPYKIDDTPLTGSFEYYLNGAHWVNANYAKKDYKLEELYSVITAITGKNVQNITNNTYIDNIHIHNGESAPADITGQVNAAKEKTHMPVRVEPDSGDEPPKKKKTPIIIAAVASLLLIAGIVIAFIAMSGSGDSSSSKSSSKKSKTTTTSTTGKKSTEPDRFELFDKDDMCSYSALLGASRSEIIDYFGKKYTSEKTDVSGGNALNTVSEYFISYDNYEYTFLDNSPKGILGFDFDSDDKVIIITFAFHNVGSYKYINSDTEFDTNCLAMYNILEERYGTRLSQSMQNQDEYGNTLFGRTGIIKEDGFPDKTITVIATYDRSLSKNYSNKGNNLDDYLFCVSFSDPVYNP